MDKLTFSDSFLYKTAERIIPGAVSIGALSEHYARYLFAANYCTHKTVLNAGCGSGYGSEILLRKAHEVYNIDISETLIAYGMMKHAKYNNHFISMDAQKLEFKDNFFDVVVGFEMIEHLPDPDRFLSECSRVLKKNGILILSTPNKVISSPQSPKPYNGFHINEWNIHGFALLVRSYFKIESVYGQRLMHPRILSFKERFFSKLVSLVVLLTPGLFYRLIKRYFLKYKDLKFGQIKIDQNDHLTRIHQNDLLLNTHGQSYGVMVIILKKLCS